MPDNDSDERRVVNILDWCAARKAKKPKKPSAGERDSWLVTFRESISNLLCR